LPALFVEHGGLRFNECDVRVVDSVPGVDFMKPFRPKFTEKNNLDKISLEEMPLTYMALLKIP
jgi:hypothetical protein